MKKLVALLLAVLMVFGLMTTAFAAEGELAGKTVILHTNDVHGAVGLYAKVAALKKDYQAKGADVILVDAGDYIQGEPYVSDSQGKTAIELMNAAGYDVATFGNHEFDYGYANLQTIAKDAKFKMIGNIRYNGKLASTPPMSLRPQAASRSASLVSPLPKPPPRRIRPRSRASPSWPRTSCTPSPRRQPPISRRTAVTS